MNKNEFTQTFFQIVGDCFSLDEEQRKKLNLKLHIDVIHSWSTKLHGLVKLSMALEEQFGIEFHDEEYEVLCSSPLGAWHTKTRRKMGKNKKATGTLLEKCE